MFINETCCKDNGRKIKNINFKKPKLKNIINNVTANPENEPDNIKNLLIKQIFSTVKWRESIINIFNEKVINFVEIGPGKVFDWDGKKNF